LGSCVSGSAAVLDVHVPVSLRSTPQSECLSRLLAELPSSSPLPRDAASFWSSYGFSSPAPFLQRTALRPIEAALFSELKARLSSTPISSASFAACLSPASRAWLLAFPSPAFSLSDREFSLASRLRLGLPPSDALPRVCRCSARMSEDPGHFLSCPLLRPLARVRHDRLVRFLATLIQRAGGAAYVEPRYLEDKRPDIHAFFPDDRVMLDVCVAHPSAPSRAGLAPGSALKYRENAKTSAYSSMAKDADSRFVPFAFESFGGLGPAAVAFLRDLDSYATESFLSASYITSLSSLAVLLQKGNAEMLAQGIVMVSRPAVQK